MAENFRGLVREIAALANIADPDRFGSEITLHVDGVPFVLLDNDTVEAGTVLYFCEFGQLPEDARRSEVLLCLLEANLHLAGVHAPAYSFDRERNEILLIGCLPLGATDGQRILQGFARYAAEAKQWQRRFRFTGAAGARRGSLTRTASKTEAPEPLE